MTDIAVAITPFVAGTISQSLDAASADLETVAAGEYAVINVKGNTSGVVISIANASGGATATLIEGDNPPSLNAGIGDGSAQSIPSGKIRLLTLPGGRYVQSDGTVRVLVGTNTCVVGAFRMARES